MGPPLYKEVIMTRSCLDKFLAELDSLLQDLPVPLIEPIWYPGIPPEQNKVREFLDQLEKVLRELVEMVIGQLEREGFFEENPVIRVYPRYQDASGVIVYYKGEKIFERWVHAYELNFGDKRQVARETQGWYEDMYRGAEAYGPGPGHMDPDDMGMSEDEYEFYFGAPPWERPR